MRQTARTNDSSEFMAGSLRSPGGSPRAGVFGCTTPGGLCGAKTPTQGVGNAREEQKKGGGEDDNDNDEEEEEEEEREDGPSSAAPAKRGKVNGTRCLLRYSLAPCSSPVNESKLISSSA
ncbi:hypothetical protein K0M31_003814 [Melipona bicolor]|uniref:Uncharacterized protein n=1 Tax=Melipona bicolor TaxID=60889 RepID=A0AA40FYF2_9HYME|nr:hypothetical protein K0M31_003814 [Melipona bicolor]